MKKMLKTAAALFLVITMVTACSSKTEPVKQPEEPANTQEATEEPTGSQEEAPEEASKEEPGKGISIALLNASNGNAWRAQMEEEMNVMVKDLWRKIWLREANRKAGWGPLTGEPCLPMLLK